MEHEHPEAEENCDFNHHEHQAAAGQREQEITAPHGSGGEALEELALAHIDQGKSNAPHSGIHDVHPNQSGNEEIDVARTGLARNHDGRRQRVLAA